MPWHPLPRIAFAVATYPFQATSPADLPLELGDELYVIEEGGKDGQWLRGYLIAPPSLLAGLTSVKGQTLEARVFSGIFPKSCVDIREVLQDGAESDDAGSNGLSMTSGLYGQGHEIPSEGTSNSLHKLAQNLKRNKSSAGQPKTTAASGSLGIHSPRDPSGIKPQAPVPMLKIGDETPTSLSEPLVDEISSCLREWHSTHLHELLLARRYTHLDKMSTLVKRLDMSRRQFLHNVLTSFELQQLRERTVWDLVKGNKLLDGEVIVRDPSARGRVMTGEDSAVEITKLQSMMSLLDERPHPVAENASLYHLLVDVKAFVGATTEPTSLNIYLVSRAPGSVAKTLSESCVVDVPAGGAFTSIATTSQMRTLFTDIGQGDIGSNAAADAELYLVVKVQQAYVPPAAPKTASKAGGTAGVEHTTNVMGEKSVNMNGGAKGSRRSMMWGKSAQRTYSRNAPTSKMAPVTEQTEVHDAGRPPGTASSKSQVDTLSIGSQSSTLLRTVGIGALKLNQLMHQNGAWEQLMTIWSPGQNFADNAQEKGGDWSDVIPDLMDHKGGHFEKSRKAERLQLVLHSLQGPDAEALIKSTPTLLSEVTCASRVGFVGAPVKPRSDIYITLGEAFLPRHALLSRSAASAVPISASLSGFSLQLTLEVRRASGERIENAIFPSSNTGPISVWESLVTERSKSWGQTIRLSVPPDDVQGAHLAIVVSDAPNKPFGICHMPLWDQQAFIRDGHHSLLLYKYDETTSTPRPDSFGRGGYLNLLWNSRGRDDVSRDEAVTGPMATLRLESYLCSTRLSQDKTLLGLLRWKEKDPGDIPDVLRRLVFVPEIEIVKLLADVFDALFGILVEYSGNDDVEDLVFGCLVIVLGIVHDRRFNLGPLVDQYAENTFNYPFATPCLVRSFTRLLANPSDPETSRKLRATFKVVRHILKFITHARGQQKAKEAGIGITSTSPGFSRHLRSIFKALDGLMRNTAPILVGSQTLAVQHFHTWLPELAALLSPEEILHIAIDFMDSCALVKGKLVLYKLILIVNYARLDLFALEEQKSALAANTVRWIAPHWGKTDDVTDQWREQVRLCCSVLATQIGFLGPFVPDHIPKIVESYLAILSHRKPAKARLSLLFPTSYPFPTKPVTCSASFEEPLIELSATLSAISNLQHGMQLELVGEDMAALLTDVLRVHLSILNGEAFPNSWLSIRIYHHRSTMSTLKYLSTILLESFMPDPDDETLEYNTELWKTFFTVLLKLVGSDALALETFPEQKRRAVWKIAGDVREAGAELLRSTWEATGWETNSDERRRYGVARMGGYQVQYVPALVPPIVELCLSVHEGLRRVAVGVLQTMIASEWTMNEDLGVIQTEMIDSIDQLFKSKPLTESVLQKLFIGELMLRFEPLSSVPGDPLHTVLGRVVSTIDEFLDLLVAVHSTSHAGEASHLMHRLRLMEFLRDMQKEEIFISYVHQLSKLQAEARNYTEAGLALRLHADLYSWESTKFLPALQDPSFPSQSSFERKESIYFEMIKHFEDGEAWSSALYSYKQLQKQYEENIFDFAKLARTQRAIATIYETISKSEKAAPKYFKVMYRGMGFPLALRDKEFIYEGMANERTSTFADRMQEQHPSAQIVNAGDIEDVEGQFLQIASLSPHRNLEHPVFQRSKVSSHVRDYLLSDRPQQFSTTVRRNIVGPVTEHWADKMVYSTSEAFPTILRRSEVVSVQKIRLSPIQTALERVVRKTQEMILVEKKVQDGDDDQIPLLIEALTVSVNAAADSSIVRYRELLPQKVTEDVDEEDPEALLEEMTDVQLTPMETALKMALVDHAVMIKRCLAMFTKSSNAQLRQSHEGLSQEFQESYAPELAQLTLPVDKRASTPATSWQMGSPNTANDRQSGSFPVASTNGTTGTGTPGDFGHQRRTSRIDEARSRISFMSGRKASTTAVNGSGPPVALHLSNGHASSQATGGEQQHSRSTSRSSNTSKDRAKRRSWFGGPPKDVHSKNGDGEQADNDWATDYEHESVGRLRGRTMTSDSTGTSGGGYTVRPLNIEKRERDTTKPSNVGGTVRKRLSLLKLGRKTSKASVLVDTVAEE